MAKIAPLDSFWKVYRFYKDMEKEALVTSIGCPKELWDDLRWLNSMADIRTSAKVDEVRNYFKLLNLGHLPKVGKLKAANDFYNSRLRGIGCVTLLGDFVEVLSLSLPEDPEYLRIELYRERMVKTGNLRKLPVLAKEYSLPQLALNDDAICGEVYTLQRQF